MTDLHALIHRMADELDHYRIGKEGDDRSHPLAAEARAALAQPAPDYIDPEHSGADRELLEVFYTACNSEGGTADEIYLRGIRAVLAAQPEPEGPTDEELLRIAANAIEPYQRYGIALNEYEAETETAVEVYCSELIAFARAVLARWGSHQPVPVSERLPGPGGL